MRAPPDRWLPRSRRGEACTTGMEEGGRGLLRRIADRQAGKGGRHRRIADRRAREEGKIKGSDARSPVVATRGGKRPYQPSLAFVHPFPLGTPKVDSPSQGRQGTAERGKCPQTVHVGGGGGGGGAMGWWLVVGVREGDGGAVSSAADRHRAADRAEERPGLAKVGRGARGARGVGGGRGQRWGPHPARRGRIPPSIIHGGESWWRRGGAPRRPLMAEPDRDGPRRMDTKGGGRGWAAGLRGPGPWWLWAGAGETGRGPWAAAGEWGRGRAGLARGRTPRGPRGLGEGSRGRPFLEGGGGLLPARGTTGAPLERGGGGRACIARCRAMSIHGRAAWDYIPNPPRRSPSWGGLRGGGGLADVVCSLPRGGGVAGGSSVRLGRKNPVASPGLMGPFEEEPRIRRGGLR